jgi:hypothetical protein
VKDEMKLFARFRSGLQPKLGSVTEDQDVWRFKKPSLNRIIAT